MNSSTQTHLYLKSRLIRRLCKRALNLPFSRFLQTLFVPSKQASTFQDLNLLFKCFETNWDSKKKKKIYRGDSGCGSVGLAGASDTRGPRFVSSHRKILYYLHPINWKDENEEKEAENDTLKKIVNHA